MCVCNQLKKDIIDTLGNTSLIGTKTLYIKNPQGRNKMIAYSIKDSDVVIESGIEVISKEKTKTISDHIIRIMGFFFKDGAKKIKNRDSLEDYSEDIEIIRENPLFEIARAIAPEMFRQFRLFSRTLTTTQLKQLHRLLSSCSCSNTQMY